MFLKGHLLINLDVFLCSIHPVIRKLAFLVLKEVRMLCSLMDLTEKVLVTVIVILVSQQTIGQHF